MKLTKLLSLLLAVLLLVGAGAVTVSALEAHGTGILMRKWLTNDPNYQFSEGYKSSVWYKNFTDLELTPNTRNNILSIAISQLGYHEGEDGDYTGTNTGSEGNCVEYFRLLIPNWSNNSDEWCACFVNWCLNQAHVDYASSEIGCWKWVGELKTMRMFQDSKAYGGTYTPKPADMIFFNWKEVNTGSGHIGYVFYTTDTRVFTIEGNADNNVTVRSYALDDPCVIGYGTPPHDEGDIPTIDHSYKNGRPRGQYVVNASNYQLMAKKGSDRICRVPLGSQVTLHEADGEYARVTFDGQEGYLPAAQLYLMIPAVGEDTLHYDANGGTGAPEDGKVTIGEAGTVSETVPTLEGDTFLGWSLIPHNYKVDFKAGDPISLTGDTTLYAVWEKRSAQLASEALSKGEVAEFPRPNAIQNSAALLLGALPDTSFFDGTDGKTEVQLIEDESGKVISFVSTEKTDDPYVLLNYAALCESLRYAPVNAAKAPYIVLRVKDVSLFNIAFSLSFDCGAGMKEATPTVLKAVKEWQYVVFDMSTIEGWSGDLTTLRIDWEKSANEAGNTLLISDIYFAASETLANAITDGLYVYPVQEELPPETEPETTASPEPETTEPATEAFTTVGGETTHTENESETEAAKGGCKTLIGSTAILLLAAAAVVCRRRKD